MMDPTLAVFVIAAVCSVITGLITRGNTSTKARETQREVSRLEGQVKALTTIIVELIGRKEIHS